MLTDPITRINRASQLATANYDSQPASTLASFGQALDSAINSLSQVEHSANSAIAKLASGEDVELHQVMLAVEEAEIAFRLALQVRNKIIDAYQEVMRMQL